PGAQGQISLRPGYVAVVSRAASLRGALVAALFPGPDDLRRLVDGEGPTRIGFGLLSGDGTPYRLLRELGGARQLQRFDAAEKKFSTLSQDNLEIESFLRVECGLPPGDHYSGFFVMESNELPSMRSRAAAGPDVFVDGAKVQALKQELEQTKRYEGIQDRLFKVQQRLLELTELGDRFRSAQDELNEIQAQLARSPWTAEQMKDLAARAARAKEAAKTAGAYMKERKDREQAVKRAYDEEQQPLKNAMRAAHVDSGSDLLQVFSEREKVLRGLDDARSQLDEARKQPDLPRIPIETPLLEEEKRKLEAEVAAQGFARPLGEIELDLKHALGLGDLRKGGLLVPEPDVP